MTTLLTTEDAMKRLALPILTLFFLLPGSLLAQIPYNPSYTPNPALYGPGGRALLPPSLGLLNNRGGFGSLAIPNETIVIPEQQRRANDLYYSNSLRALSQAQGVPPGGVEADLFAFQNQAGHPAGFGNTLGFYPPNPRQTVGRPQTTPGSSSGSSSGSSRTPTTPGARQ